MCQYPVLLGEFLDFNQMVHKGNHHHQAVCACATHLLDRVYVVLKQDRPYELRDVDHRSLTPEQARATIAQHYTVPSEVRQRSQRRARKARAERRIERQHKPMKAFLAMVGERKKELEIASEGG